MSATIPASLWLTFKSDKLLCWWRFSRRLITFFCALAGMESLSLGEGGKGNPVTARAEEESLGHQSKM